MNRYTPVPPIKSPAASPDPNCSPGHTPVDTPVPDDDDDDDKLEELDETFHLQTTDPLEIKEQLKTRLLTLYNMDDFSSEASKQQMIFLNAAGVDFGFSVETGKQMGEMLTSFNFAEIFQNILKRHFTDTLFDQKLMDVTALYNLLVALQVMWNISDKSPALCERVVKIGLHSDMFDALQSETLSPGNLSVGGEVKRMVIQGLLGTLHNIVQKVSNAREAFRECNAVDILQPFRENSEHKMISCVALMIQSYLVTEHENEKINSGSEVFKLLVKLLDCSIHHMGYNGVNFATIEVLEVLNKLAANDNNKQRIVEQGALSYYVQLLQTDNEEREQAEAAHGLWTLAFKCKDSVNNEPGCIQALQSLVEHTASDEVRKQAEGALWILQEKVSDSKIDTSNGSAGHVFISYQWDAKATVLKICEKLRQAGYKVWIDEDDMSGSVLEAMAEAVEKAAVVIFCISQKYKDSPSTRTEAEYAYRLRKSTIPVRVQPGYYPDGWLGALTGSKLVFDCSLPSKIETSIKNLIKELGNQGKTVPTDETDAIQPTLATVTHTLYPSHEKVSPINSWTTDDINSWLQKHSLEHLNKLFVEFDGATLLEYQSMRQDAPEAFFSDLVRDNVSRSDRLRLSRAIKDLV